MPSLASLLALQAASADESTQSTKPAFDGLVGALEWAKTYGQQLLGAALTLLVGLWVARLIGAACAAC